MNDEYTVSESIDVEKYERPDRSRRDVLIQKNKMSISRSYSKMFVTVDSM